MVEEIGEKKEEEGTTTTRIGENSEILRCLNFIVMPKRSNLEFAEISNFFSFGKIKQV